MPRKDSHRAASRGPGILERLAKGVVLGDGGYLLELEKRGYVQAGPFTPEVVLERPGPCSFRRAAERPVARIARLRHRGDLLMARRGAPRRRADREDGPALHGDDVLRQEPDVLRRTHPCRMRSSVA